MNVVNFALCIGVSRGSIVEISIESIEKAVNAKTAIIVLSSW